MKIRVFISCLISIVFIFLISVWYCSKCSAVGEQMVSKAFKTEDIRSLFTVTADDIQKDVLVRIGQAKAIINDIIEIPDTERTFSNTIKKFDELLVLSNLAIAQRVYEALELCSPDQSVQNAAHDAFVLIQNFWVDNVSSNKKIYNAFVSYVSRDFNGESLTDEQRYFINETIDSFKREGLSLSDETLVRVNAIRKELSELTADFDRNIAQDATHITVKYDELRGLNDEFISSLSQDDNGFYKLGIDYPTYFRVMEECLVASTREHLYKAFNNRAYPVNSELLKKIIKERDELATLLGFPDFAHLDLADQMAHTPERAHSFIDDLIKKASSKTEAEINTLIQELPESVILTEDGKLQPWDFAFVENIYKRNHFNIDEQNIAHYFPMENTIKELLDVYHQFMGIDFEEETITGFWHDTVKVIRVLNKSGDLLGTLILDLYPRANKYNHAAHTTIIPATILEDGTKVPDVSVIIANFPKPTSEKPSLLKRNEVKTFFHEFGHALHAILGATSIASLSGTHTKTDFVELPSQMLEEWLYDRDILKKVSRHYQTGQPLPDDIINNIIALKSLTSGYFVTRQCYLSEIALRYFGQGKDKDPYLIMKQLYNNIIKPIAFSSDRHFYASFGHLTGYGAKYYGYIWSKVFALDLFAEIKKHGLLNPHIGQKYVKEILAKGGTQDPNELLYNFLEREPSSTAFFQDMGL